MKLIPIMIAILALGLLGWSFAQDKPAGAATPAPATPTFAPTETIRPDQGVAFPVDI